jgi:hypothetical protein
VRAASSCFPRFGYWLKRSGASGLRIRSTDSIGRPTRFSRYGRRREYGRQLLQDGDPEDLAAQLIALLESPEAQRQAAAQNYSAAIRMTMPHVVCHYLRWFELERRKRAFRPTTRRRWLDRWRFGFSQSALYGLPPDAVADWALRGVLSDEDAAPSNGHGPAHDQKPVPQPPAQG